MGMIIRNNLVYGGRRVCSPLDESSGQQHIHADVLSRVSVALTSKFGVPVMCHGAEKSDDASELKMPGSYDTPLWCRGENGTWFRRSLRYLGSAVSHRLFA